MNALFFKKIHRLFIAVKYSLYLEKLSKEFHEFTEEKKCNFVIATYVFSLQIFVFLAIYVYIFTLLDKGLYESVAERMKNGVVSIQILGVVLLGIGRLGHFSLRRVNWNRMPKEDVVGDKISLAFQTAGIVVTLFILCGIF